MCPNTSLIYSVHLLTVIKMTSKHQIERQFQVVLFEKYIYWWNEIRLNDF